MNHIIYLLICNFYNIRKESFSKLQQVRITERKYKQSQNSLQKVCQRQKNSVRDQ